ncbi:hypothetical protein FOXB_05088, partial [Fusarium oxysporum f. sp. conglutinans Fo5176]
KFLTIYKTYIT